MSNRYYVLINPILNRRIKRVAEIVKLLTRKMGGWGDEEEI
jgi:hypothetical protein